MAQQDHFCASKELREGVVCNSSSYPNRNCPSCDASPSSGSEISSPVAASSLPFENLVPQWNGFFKEKSFFPYTRCSACGLLYAPEFFDDDQLARLYAQMPPNMDQVPVAALRATQQGYFEVLKRHSPLKGGFVEIGPDIGLFTENCVREGEFSEYWLLEPNQAVGDALSSVVKGTPHHIIHDMFGFSQVPLGAASVAVMVHVLDHLLDPVPMLKRLRDALRPDAILLIVTHDESSLLRRLTGWRWPAFCLQHPQLYNPKSIRGLLDTSGFEVIEVTKTVNHFEIGFLFKHLLWAMGWRIQRTPILGNAVVGLKLGNILTVAKPRRS
jgi:hypothetical protein